MKIAKKIGIGLLVLSLLFLCRSSYEMFILTLSKGPQMIFFSILHSWPSWMIVIFFVSWFAYYGYLGLSGVLSALVLFPKFKNQKKDLKIIRATFFLFTAHLILFLTYLKWASLLFGNK